MALKQVVQFLKVGEHVDVFIDVPFKSLSIEDYGNNMVNSIAGDSSPVAAQEKSQGIGPGAQPSKAILQSLLQSQQRIH